MGGEEEKSEMLGAGLGWAALRWGLDAMETKRTGRSKENHCPFLR